MRNAILLAVATYLAASINFSILLFKALGKGDPRDKFSGNPGVTNVTRQIGRGWGLVILLLDMSRAGAIAQFGTWLLPAPFVPLLGAILVLGNQKPLFHGFRGGKGVASYLGFAVIVSPFAAGISSLAWVVAYGIFRQPFIGSFFMVAVLGLGTLVQYSWAWPTVLGTVLTTGLIFQAHKTNVAAYRIGRIKRGMEI